MAAVQGILDVLAAHNVQGVTIANLQKDRTGLDDIPKDWLGGLSGGPCTVASTELIRRTYAEYGDRFAIAGVGGVFTPNRPMRRFAPVPRSSCSSRRSCTARPRQITVLKRGLAKLLRRDGFRSVAEAVGVDA